MPGYIYSNAPHERVLTLEAWLDPGTERTLAALAFDRNGVALEAGAGGGSIARWLCTQMGPRGRVVATDIDVTALEQGPNPSNLEVLRHDIVVDELEVESYDLIHARLLISHLPERKAVLLKLVAALKTGGYLVIEGYDWAGAVPVSDHGRALYERVRTVALETLIASGVDPYEGRALPQFLRDVGLIEVEHEGRVQLLEAGSAGSKHLMCSLEALRPRLTKPGLLTNDEVDQSLVLLEDESFSTIGPAMFAAWGRQPGSG